MSRDPAADAAVCGLLLLATACATGLALGVAGVFSLAPIATLAALAGVAGWWWRPRDGVPRSSPARWWEPLLVFLVAVVFYLPGYDVVVYGSDATAYLDVGAYLARTGSLAIADPVLDRMPVPLQRRVFPVAVPGEVPGLYRSIAGLVFDGYASPVWSTFSALPSVWLGLGWAAGGETGARAVTPLLGATGVTAVFLLVRRLAGRTTAWLAAVLLGMALPQVFFARLPMGEVGGQAFLWLALVAFQRYHDTRAPVAAIACGAGLGLATVARIEYALFLPLALLLGEIAGRGWRTRLPALALPLVVLGLIWATVATLVLVPTHYRAALAWTLDLRRMAAAGAAAPWQGALLAVSALAAAAFLWQLRGRGALMRIGFVVLLAAWAALYIGLGRSRAAGGALWWLPDYVGWGATVLAVPGLLWLAWRGPDGPSGRLALLLAAVTGAHLVLDLHAAGAAVWAGRRLLPVVLPVLCWGVASVVVTIGARLRGLGVAVAVVVLVLAARPVRALVDANYWEGAGAQVASLAARFPVGTVLLLDASLRETLLDVGLWLVHGRTSIVLPGPSGQLETVPALLVAAKRTRVFLLSHGMTPMPDRPGLRFVPVEGGSLKLRLPGGATGRTVLLPVKAFEVFFARAKPAEPK
ncbi:MAG: glycosyltransferase family 39 protein [bacterium]|nr:glycosyltransferase family 39 protein [bacterium]